MTVHYINDYLSANNLDTLDYYDCNFINELNNYIQYYIDTSYWSRADIVRVSSSRYSECYGNDTLFFWDGTSVVYPFYNGTLNNIGTCEFEIDTEIDSCGFTPNLFQCIHDFYPDDVIGVQDGMYNKILFTDLSSFSDSIFDNCVKYNAGCITVSISYFYAGGVRYFIMFIGDMTDEISNYIYANRPYDFDIESCLPEHDINITLNDIYDTYGCSGEHVMFIHPRFLYTDFDSVNCNNRLQEMMEQSRSVYTQSNGGNFNVSNTNLKRSKKNTNVKNKCVSVTSKGVQCSRVARDGSDFCGIHINEIDEAEQCTSVTAKGVRCGRLAKDGFYYCGIHLR